MKLHGNRTGDRLKMASALGYTSVRVGFRCGESESLHSIYSKQHVVREDSPLTPTSRTLLTLGWPPYVQKHHLNNVYSAFGTVQQVFMKRSPGPIRDLKELDVDKVGFKCAYVVFSAEDGLRKALQQDSLKVGLEPEEVGMGKWCTQYMATRTAASQLKSAADKYMQSFDQKERERDERLCKLQEPDEEGWVTVVPKGKKRLATGEKSVSQRVRRKKKNKELLNFYSFQLRESRREQIAQLRKKFEEDKQKVLVMKAKRKFKPF